MTLYKGNAGFGSYFRRVVTWLIQYIGKGSRNRDNSPRLTVGTIIVNVVNINITEALRLLVGSYECARMTMPEVIGAIDVW